MKNESFHQKVVFLSNKIHVTSMLLLNKYNGYFEINSKFFIYGL